MFSHVFVCPLPQPTPYLPTPTTYLPQLPTYPIYLPSYVPKPIYTYPFTYPPNGPKQAVRILPECILVF